MSASPINPSFALDLLDPSQEGVVTFRSTVMWVGAEEPARFSLLDPCIQTNQTAKALST